MQTRLLLLKPQKFYKVKVFSRKLFEVRQRVIQQLPNGRKTERKFKKGISGMTPFDWSSEIYRHDWDEIYGDSQIFRRKNVDLSEPKLID